LVDSFSIGRHTIGSGGPPLFLFDIGTYFYKDINLAEKLIFALKEAGINIVKGEILHNSEICYNDDTLVEFPDQNAALKKERYRDIIESKVISLEEYKKLFDFCKKQNMEFVLSVYDTESANFAKEIGAVALKIASSNIVHQPLIEHVSTLGLPLFIDTGKSTMEEISRAINWAQDAGAKNIIIQHSPLALPNPVEEHNMKFMCALGNIFGLPYSLSCHHAGEEMLYAAVALGASAIEKGLCPDDLGTDLDGIHALSVGKVGEVVQKCMNIYKGLGDGVRYLPKNRTKFISRMGLVAKRDIVSGDVISLDSVTFSFPAKGIPVECWEEVVGWKFRSHVSSGKYIKWADIEPAGSS
jgi:sialic acid synthase SpsE